MLLWLWALGCGMQLQVEGSEEGTFALLCLSLSNLGLLGSHQL